MPKVLLIEDSKEIQDLIVSIMHDKYSVDLAETLNIAENKLKQSTYDLILLDLGLPDGNGFEICSRISSKYGDTKVMVLSARKSVLDKVHGFELGIEDYIEKPFNPLELRARIDAKMRKIKQSNDVKGQFQMGPLMFDLDLHALHISRNGEKTNIAVTPIEFKILLTLCRQAEKTHSRDELVASIWSDTPNIGKRGIDTHISHLRKKLEVLGDVIESKYGAGYQINLPRS